MDEQNKLPIEEESFEGSNKECIEIQLINGILIRLISTSETMNTLHGRALSLAEDLGKLNGDKPPASYT